ncbi:flavin reductase family protein [Pseudochryseolinea flava]|nr:flavin reductase [Pseudochryseolinea flava]
METRYRANLINSLGGFKGLVLIGTKSCNGNENLATFNSLFHLGANPALCGIVVRPNEEKENTLGNIINTRYYTLNHVRPEFYRQAHQCSASYEHGRSEFKEVGLTPEYFDGIPAPFVAESNIKFACKLERKIDIDVNGTFIIIGRIMRIILPDEYLNGDGFINLQHAGTMTCSGLDSYHITKEVARLRYAKPDLPPREI